MERWQRDALRRRHRAIESIAQIALAERRAAALSLDSTLLAQLLGRVELRAPIVIRLDGTNAEEGRRILADAGIPPEQLQSQPTMLEAARAAVAIANA